MKKIGLLTLVVILALGVIGAGYAAWSQTLHINGNATAATFDVNFTNATNPAIAPTGGTATNDFTVPTKTVGLTVTNVYPGYSGDFILTVTNSSSIPVTLAISKDASPVDPLSLWSASANPGGSVAAGATFNYTVHVIVPNTWTGNANSGLSSNAAFSILASQTP